MNSQKNAIVVTGSTGNIGSKLVASLLLKGERVIAITRDAAKTSELKKLGAEIAVGQMDDAEFLTSVFTHAKAVFALIPPEYGATSFRGRQNIIGDAIARAIVAADVSRVVNLSSLGAEHAQGVGPIKGLYDQEQRLNKIQGLDLVHLRAAYFFENIFFGAGLIKDQGIFGTAVKEDVKFSHVTTIDIAAIACDLLTQATQPGIRIVEAISEESTTMAEVTSTISNTLAKKIPYVTFPYEGTHTALVASGLSTDVADQFVELYDAMNKSLIRSNGLQYPLANKVSFSKFINDHRSVIGG